MQSQNCPGLSKPDRLTLPVITGRRLGQELPYGAVGSPDMADSGDGRQSPVPSMPNYARHHSNVPQSQVAGHIVTHVDDLLGALAEMHEVNRFWKDKYMTCRADHINKYIPTAGTRVLERTFHFWKGYIFEMGNVQRLQRLKHTMLHFEEDAEETIAEREANHQATLQQIQRDHESKVEGLASMIEKQNNQCKELLRERDYYASRDETSGELLKGMRTMMDATPERAYAVGGEAVKEHAGDFEFTKNVMHEILNEVDPKYVPPMGSLAVPPPPSHLRILDGKSIIQQLGMDTSFQPGKAPRR